MGSPSRFRFPTFRGWSIRGYGIAATIALIATALTINLLTNTPNSEIEIRNSTISYVAIAEITHTDSGVYNFGRENYVGQPLTYGHISTEYGETEFMLNNRVFVYMHGKGEMYLRDSMNIVMSAGSATYTVPEKAHGFTVHLPDGTRVVDLGTQFEITIGEDGRTNVRVTEGSVRLDDSTGTAIAHLTAGKWVYLADGRIQDSDVIGYDAAANGGAYHGAGVLDTSSRVWASGGSFTLDGETITYTEILRIADNTINTVNATSPTGNLYSTTGSPVIDLFRTFSHTGNPTRHIEVSLTGLDDSRTYNMTMFGVQTRSSGFRGGLFTITTGGNGSAATTADPNGDNYATFALGVNYVRFNSLTPVSGRIAWKITAPTGHDLGAYNGFEIESVTGTGIPAPAELDSTDGDDNKNTSDTNIDKQPASHGAGPNN